MAASLLAAGLAASPIFTAGRLAPLLGALAAAGLLCVRPALLARGRFTGAALFTLAIEDAAAEATGDVPAGSVIGYTAGQLLTLVAIAAAAAVLAVAVLGAASLRLPGALEATLLGYRRRGGPARPALAAAAQIHQFHGTRPVDGQA